MNRLGVIEARTVVMRTLFVVLIALPFSCKTTDPEPTKTIPTVVTFPSFVQDQNSFTIQGNVSSDGFDEIISRGIVYSDTDRVPTVAIVVNATTIGTGSFQCTVNNLDTKKIYYVRAFATNSKGTGYGAPLVVSTTYGPPPTTILNHATRDTTNGKQFSFSANMTSEGGTPSTERGIAFDTRSIPEESSPSVVFRPFGSGIGNYDGVVDGLSQNTVYYVRAYARNKAGVSFSSNEFSLTTVGVPVIETANIPFDLLGAKLLALVTSSGGLKIKKQGFVWGTVANPDTLNNRIEISLDSTTKFRSIIDSSLLTIGTTYRVRSYAINSIGITYSSTQFFVYLPIGGNYKEKGGIIFWLDPTDVNRKQGMVVTAEDIPGTAIWGCIGDSIVTGSNIGAGSGGGNSNTTNILGKCSDPTIAAKICRTHIVVSGSSSISLWNLPSSAEWKEIQKALYKPNLATFSTSATYWTSTQSSDSKAFAFKFDADRSIDGTTSSPKKSVSLALRGVKTF